MSEQKNNYWFTLHKSKKFWVPVRWEGFLIVALYIISIIASFVYGSSSDILIDFVPQFILYTVFLLFILFQKGEPFKEK